MALHLIQINEKDYVAQGNAYHGLKELRLSKSTRVIWMDAICINQQDLKEKEDQILLMNTIYKAAVRVVVWLPPPRRNEDLAMTLLEELHTQHDSGMHTIESMSEVHYLRLRSPEWIALRDFLSHPWFSRVWTLQEAVLAREIIFQFGSHVIPWDRLQILGVENELLFGMLNFEPGESLYGKTGQPSGCGAISTIQWIRICIQAGRRFSLSELLPQVWFREATDIRDCIYGLFGLSCDIVELDLHPEYSHTVSKVLTHVVQKLLLKGESFELLSKAGCGFDRSLEDLPSYVPDWSAIPTPPPLYWQAIWDLPGNDESIGVGISLHETGKLQIRFAEMDVIKEVSNPLNRVEPQQILRWFDTVERMALCCAEDLHPQSDSTTSRIPIFEAFWRTIIANSTNDHLRPPGEWFHGYLRYKDSMSYECGKVSSSLFVDTKLYDELYSDAMDPTHGIMMNWYNMMLKTT